MSTAANEHGRQENLKRFGYGLIDGESRSDANLGALWHVLRSDFQLASGDVPEFDDLQGAQRAKAHDYASHCADLHRMMDICDALHLRILREGAGAELVELYTTARDEYEDAVERFGELRIETQAELSAN